MINVASMKFHAPHNDYSMCLELFLNCKKSNKMMTMVGHGKFPDDLRGEMTKGVSH